MASQIVNADFLTFRDRLSIDEAGELAVTHAFLRRASQGHLTRVARIYSPAAPVVVFGRRDTRLPGFRAAVQGARDSGFDVAVRAVGGRVVAYTENAVVLDVIQNVPRAGDGLEARFTEYGHRTTAALRRLGVDARVGAVPGEYCPGAHSVNARGVVKLLGSAQRVVKDAWLMSALLIVDDEEAIQDVLTDVHAHLGFAFDSSSVGSVRTENHLASLASTRAALEEAWGLAHGGVATLDRATAELASDLEPMHRLNQ